MDYIDGRTLDDYLAEHTPPPLRGTSPVSGEELCSPSKIEGEGGVAARGSMTGGIPESEVIRILKPIAAALDYAHGEGVVHRDVKPIRKAQRRATAVSCAAAACAATRGTVAPRTATGTTPATAAATSASASAAPQDRAAHEPLTRQDGHVLPNAVAACPRLGGGKGADCLE